MKWQWIKNNLLKATFDYYESQKSEAIAHLEILFKKSVGIGEHTDLLSEIKKWTDSLSQAEDNIKSLLDNFDEYGEVERKNNE